MTRLGGALVLGLVVTVAALAFGSRPLGVVGVGLLFANDEPEDRRLARPVWADQPHLFALEERKRGIDKEDLMPVLARDRVEANH